MGQAAGSRRRIGFTALANGLASCEDSGALQAICDRFGPDTVQVWFERWMAQIPLPLDDADRTKVLAGAVKCTSRTLVFDSDVHARAFFEALLCWNMDLAAQRTSGCCSAVSGLAAPEAPPIRGGFRTAIDRYCQMVTINVFYKNSRVKQYLKKRRCAAHRDGHQLTQLTPDGLLQKLSIALRA